ncbi:hypothetical protein C9439_01010 [archaeon SCG-AAA382B04]|nr:hypothetical protein C9439_01010 [archaeon SCG-AAA382B04]
MKKDTCHSETPNRIQNMPKKQFKLGISSILVLLVSLAVSISQNNWFVWTKNALSDLGGPEATNPWIFNFGLIIAGLLGMLYFSKISSRTKNRFQKIGLTTIILDLFLLILVGVFSIESPLHYPLSVSFFAVLVIGALIFGIGELEVSKNKGITYISITILSLISSIIILNTFEGIAIAEIHAVIVYSTLILGEKFFD